MSLDIVIIRCAGLVTIVYLALVKAPLVAGLTVVAIGVIIEGLIVRSVDQEGEAQR